MRLKIIFLCYLAIVELSYQKVPESSCSGASYPLKDITRCCNLPRFSNPQFERICYSKCSRYEHDFEQNKNCILDCMVREYHLLKEDGRINKLAVMKMYASISNQRRNWTRLIEQAVNYCGVETVSSLDRKLQSFFACVKSDLSVNCIDFKNWISDCTEIEEHFEMCKKVSSSGIPDCTRIPISIVNARDCCSTPRLIPNATVDKCRDECDTIDFLEPLEIACIENCEIREAALKTNGHFDFNVIKKLLLQNADREADWALAGKIDFAVSDCRNAIHGT